MPREDSRPDNEVSEIITLVRAYAKQETVDPLKGLVRYVLFGVAGSVVLGVGVILLLLALLRALQTETGDTFDGNWTADPYATTLAVAGVVAALALAGIGRRTSRRTEKGARR